MLRAQKFIFSSLSFFIICLLMPFLIGTIVHFDFISNYSIGSLSIDSFHDIYFHGIYRYRVLGRVIFEQLYHCMVWLNAHGVVLHHISSFTLNRLGSNSVAVYYLTQYVNDMGFLVLTAIALFYLFSRPFYQLSVTQRNVAILLILFFIGLSQFVITVYDGLYNLLTVMALIFIFEDIYSEKKCAFLGVAIVMVLGALTIEHSVTILSMYAWTYFDKYRFQVRQSLWKLVILIAIFFIIYFILRYVYGTSHGLYDVLAFNSVNMHYLYLTALSLLFLLGGSLCMVGNGEQLKRVCIFLFFTLPYIAAIFTFAFLAELRVWLPVIIPAMCFSLLRPRLKENYCDSISRQ